MYDLAVVNVEVDGIVVDEDVYIYVDGGAYDFGIRVGIGIVIRTWVGARGIEGYEGGCGCDRYCNCDCELFVSSRYETNVGLGNWYLRNGKWELGGRGVRLHGRRRRWRWS